MTKVEDFAAYTPTWCPGCGDWGIGAAIKASFAQLGLDPSSLAIIFGIGCSGNMNAFLNPPPIPPLQERAFPKPMGEKPENHKMRVVAFVGAGICFGEEAIISS